MICMHFGEQNSQNGPENHMLSKLRLENKKFFRQTGLGNGGAAVLLPGLLSIDNKTK